MFLADLQNENSQKIPELPVALRVERASFEWELPCKPPTKSDTPARLIGRVAQAWNKAIKAAKEKGRELKRTTKRASYVPRCRSEKGQEVKDSAPQDPRTSLPTCDEKQPLKKEREVFKLHDIDLEIPHGQLCAIVGPVGAGKSSLVQGMIGGMALRPEVAKLTHKHRRDAKDQRRSDIRGKCCVLCTKCLDSGALHYLCFGYQ